METHTKTNYTSILCSCNAYKERQSATPLCTFSENDQDKVLDYIKAHLDFFFDGNKKQKENHFKDLFRRSLMARNIADAINGDPKIYAVVQQIPTLEL